MNAYEKIWKLEEQEFKLITGITKEVFTKSQEVLQLKYAQEHAQGGRAGLPVESKTTGIAGGLRKPPKRGHGLAFY